MKTKDAGILLLLSALWGGSFLCIRVAAPVLGPIVLIELRVLVAGIALLLFTLITKSNLDVKKRWLHYIVIGILNSAIPFTLIAIAELHLTAGIAAILNATTPLFSMLIAAVWIKEALTVRKMIGLFLGLVGVVVVVGWNPLPFSTVILWSVLASLGAAVCYGFGGIYIKVKAQGGSPIALTTCSQLAAALFLLPFIPFAPVHNIPTFPVLLAVTVLALFCTAIAYLLYFRLIENVGPIRAMTVTFLAPIFGVLWGVVLLGEPLPFSMILGFVIILVGTGFVVGIRLPQKNVGLERQKVN